MNRAERAGKVRQRLARAIPRPVVELDFDNAWQLLIATMLAAQSTDKTINTITPTLFARWPTPADLAGADLTELEVVVRSSGYYRNKAKAIKKASATLVSEFAGEVPRTIDELVTLPGVARKTANVVLGMAYRISSGIVVDTHVGRVSRRLALTRADDPVAVERDLCQLFAKRSWVDTSHRLVLHGRYVCLGRKPPECARCPLNELCPASQDEPAGGWGARARWEQELVESRGTRDESSSAPKR